MSSSAPEPAADDADGGWLTRVDQAAVALLVALALVALPAYWVTHGGLRGRWIEIDQAAPQEARFQVDVNRADWPELAQLPGIGPTLAQRIIEHRQRHGPFSAAEDLLRVNGLGAATLERLRPHLAPFLATPVVAGPTASR